MSNETKQTSDTLSIGYRPPPENKGDIVMTWGNRKVNFGQGEKAKLMCETVAMALDVVQEAWDTKGKGHD